MYPQYPLASSRFDFYKPEIMIVLAHSMFFYVYLRSTSGEFVDILFLLIYFIPIFFFCFDHAYSIIFDKELNSITIITKALFINKYRITKKYKLDDYTGAIVDITSSISQQRGNTSESETYTTALLGKNGNLVNLHNGRWSGNYLHHAKIAEKINKFYNSDQKHLKIDEKPFIARLISCGFILFIYMMMFQFHILSVH